MSLEIKGTLHKKFEAQDIKPTFKKREFVIETDEKYPQLIKFELVQDNCPLIDDFNEGDELKVEFNLRGREWNEKYFSNLHAWRITKLGASVEQNTPTKLETTQVMPADSSDDDLPF